MDMEKKKKIKRGLLKALAIGLVSILSCFTMSACVGMGAGGGGYKPSDDDDIKYENPYEGKSKDTISDYNNVLLGGIGVYDIDNNAEAFYDNFLDKSVSFNTLINRQFVTLATVLCNSLKSAYGDGVFNGNIDGYGSSTGFNFNDVVTTTIYNETSTLKYINAMNGGYKFIRTEIKTEQKDSDGNVIKDASGNIQYDITYEYKYSDTEINAERAWKNNSITVEDISNALRYIYVNPITLEGSLGQLRLDSESSMSASLKNLKNKYSNFSSRLVSNENISTIGFSEEYMWNVLYFLAYSIIGESNINNSIDGANIVFNGNSLNEVNEGNYQIFDKYKGYDKVLPELVSNAFKLIIDGNVKVGSNYCFDLDNYNGFYNKTLFPILERNEYIFFDNINDICDAEASKYSSGGEDKDWSKLDPNEVEEYDPTKQPSQDEIENAVVKVGSLRKIKKIILIPNINKSKYSKENFSINNITWCLSTETGELELEILTNIIDESGKEYLNEKFRFDDGSFTVTLPDGTVIDNNSKDSSKGDNEQSSTKDLMVTDSGRLVIQNVPSTNKYSNMGSIFDSEEISASYKFSSVDKVDIINEAFKSISYDVTTTNEKINCGRLKVCNRLFSMKKASSQDKLNGVESKISINSTNNNYVEFVFNYYNKGGSAVSKIPPLYLLEFTL